MISKKLVAFISAGILAFLLSMLRMAIILADLGR
jgi:hypothetical protein